MVVAAAAPQLFVGVTDAGADLMRLAEIKRPTRQLRKLVLSDAAGR